MASFELKDGYGSLFKNKEKKDPKHSDYNGRIKVEGVEYYLNGFIKETKSGEKYFGLSLKPVTPKTETAPATKKVDEFDDESGTLPF